jgi:hypothetical protein
VIEKVTLPESSILNYTKKGPVIKKKTQRKKTEKIKSNLLNPDLAEVKQAPSSPKKEEPILDQGDSLFANSRL